MFLRVRTRVITALLEQHVAARRGFSQQREVISDDLAAPGQNQRCNPAWSFEIGNFEEWCATGLSDHAPLIAEFKEIAKRIQPPTV